MNVCNEWHTHLLFNFFECFSRFHRGHRYSNDLATHCNNTVYLIDGRCHISGPRIRHRLNSNGSAITNGDVTYINTRRLSAFNRAFCKHLITYKGSAKRAVLPFWYEEISTDSPLTDMRTLSGAPSVTSTGGTP